MHHVSDAPPPFFHRGPSPFARLAVFGLLSLALLFTDSRYGYLEGIRSVVAIALHPLQRIVQIPGETLAWVATYFTSQRELAHEVASLKQQVLAQAPAAQGQGLLRDENAALRALLAVHARFANAATAAEVLYTGRDPFSQKLFLNRGTDAG
nr:rod shape-determining protein MreC [Betaproteobacteria bacterium]